jgi:hypothetical protein
MSTDPDLRSRLHRLAGEVDPDVERRFTQTIRSADRRTRIRRAGTITFEMTAVLVLVGILVFRSDIVPFGGEPTASAPTTLSGSWTTTLDSSETSVVSNGLNGVWVIGFPASGVLDVTPPETYIGPSSGYSFQVTGDSLRTNLLGADVCSSIPPGTYRYQQGAGVLTLIAVDDACTGRVALLTSSPWTPANGE